MTAKQTAAARRAWQTRRSTPFKARRTSTASQRALSRWATANGWRVVFLDALSGHPRTGIVDAVLVRIAPGAADKVDVQLVQLKSGTAGLTGGELRRLKAAAKRAQVTPLGVCHDGKALSFPRFA
jgi:hypothetical protein